jgi:serine phosphatase RsbU (regulator of sigma subunit)
VLGLSTREVFERRTISLEPGDTLVAVIDGITEAGDLDGAVFDRTVLDGLLKGTVGSARDLAEHIHAARAQEKNVEPPPDDQTVVVVRLMGDVAETLVPVPIKPHAFAHAAGV